MANTSAMPAAMTNSIELPKSLYAAARSPASPQYHISPVIFASGSRTDSNNAFGPDTIIRPMPSRAICGDMKTGA